MGSRVHPIMDRPFSSATAGAAPEEDPLNGGGKTRKNKRTRDLPDLSKCQACSFRVSNIGKDRLQTLASEWRVVLLCTPCCNRVESAKICCYCFSNFQSQDCSYRCLQCSRRVHKDCVLQGTSVAPWSYSSPPSSSSGFSVCIDCWVPPRLFSISNRKRVSTRGSPKVSCDNFTKNPKVSDPADECDDSMKFEIAAKEACCVAVKKIVDATSARNKAFLKALAARRAVDSASNALELVGTVGEDNHSPTVVDDAQLALRLHRAMNSSTRISRNLCQVHSACPSIQWGCIGDIASYRPNASGELKFHSFVKLPENGNMGVMDNVIDSRTPVTGIACSVGDDKSLDLCQPKSQSVFQNHEVFRDERCQSDVKLTSHHSACEFSKPDRYLIKYLRRRPRVCKTEDGDHRSKDLRQPKPQAEKHGEFRDERCQTDAKFSSDYSNCEVYVTSEKGICSKHDRYLKKYVRRRRRGCRSKDEDDRSQDVCQPKLQAEFQLHGVYKDELCQSSNKSNFQCSSCEDSLTFEKGSCSKPDPYLKKYSRRNQRVCRSEDEDDRSQNLCRSKTQMELQIRDVGELCQSDLKSKPASTPCEDSITTEKGICSKPDPYFRMYFRRRRQVRRRGDHYLNKYIRRCRGLKRSCSLPN